MIKYPISNRDLLRNVMSKCPAAQVVFIDPQIQKFAADALKGLCSFNVIKDPEIKETVEVCDLDGNCYPYETTRQQHHVEVNYYNPVDEFEIKLSIDNAK
jgi:hypothetical protein